MQRENPVLLLTRNCLELTKRCVQSIYGQDIPVYVCVFDNGSVDGTVPWISENVDYWDAADHNAGVSEGWNAGLTHLFNLPSVDHVLVVGNDTILAPWTISALLSCELPFVTGFDFGMDPLPERPDIQPITPHPDFSCYLIRRDCWEKVGRFNEAMKLYASDCDYHVRAHRLGIPLQKASVPYNHERSSTTRLAPPEERSALAKQAAEDRKVFESIYGVIPGQQGYDNLFR